MRAIVLVMAGSCLVLASCERGQEAGTAAPAAPAPAVEAPAAGDFVRPLNAVGNEPFWALKIRPEGLAFSAPDMTDITAPNPGPKTGPEQAVWSATGSDGRPLVATLRTVVCEDGMSGASYPFTATVEAAGRTLQGCAAYADAMPRPE